MEQYRTAVRNFAAKGTNYMFHNEGNEHALIIFTNLFANAREHIRIAANMLYNDEVVNTKEYIGSMKSFLDRRDSRLSILITTRPPVDGVRSHDKETSFYWMLYNHPAFRQGRIEIKEGSGSYFHGEDGQQVNFCTCDSKMYRLESDVKLRKAVANFGDSASAIDLEQKFDAVYPTLKDVCLKEYYKE